MTLLELWLLGKSVGISWQIKSVGDAVGVVVMELWLVGKSVDELTQSRYGWLANQVANPSVGEDAVVGVMAAWQISWLSN